MEFQIPKLILREEIFGKISFKVQFHPEKISVYRH